MREVIPRPKGLSAGGTSPVGNGFPGSNKTLVLEEKGRSLVEGKITLSHSRDGGTSSLGTPPPFPLHETIDVLVAGVSRLGILKPSRQVSFDGATASRHSMPMTRID